MRLGAELVRNTVLIQFDHVPIGLDTRDKFGKLIIFARTYVDSSYSILFTSAFNHPFTLSPGLAHTSAIFIFTCLFDDAS
jgi:hypothetical protein